MHPSFKWRFSIETEFEVQAARSQEEALAVASGIDAGELNAAGDAGDAVSLQFDSQHAFILYMKPDRTLLRPCFPAREKTGDGVEASFCKCCGVELGARSELLAQCTTRAEGFSLCAEILQGQLPTSDIQWVPLVGTSSEV